MKFLGLNLDFGQWFYGLIAAFIGGGSGAFAGGIALIVVDPHDFNIFVPKFWAIIATTFVIGGLTPFFAYLHQQPMPEFKDVERVKQTITSAGGEKVTLDTVKETSKEPIKTEEK